MKLKIKNFVISTLRRASYKYSERATALKEARVGRNQYICVECGKDKVHPRSNIQVDHIHPVIPVEGFTNFDDYIVRLFCEKEGFQILCKEHHKKKTFLENEERKKNKLKKYKK